MRFSFFYLNLFLNLKYKDFYFFKKIYYLGYDYKKKKYTTKLNFLIFFIDFFKIYNNFLKNKFIYKFVLNNELIFFLFKDFFLNKIKFIYFLDLKKIYIFFLNLIFFFFYIFNFYKKYILFYKKNFLIFCKEKIINFNLDLSYFYNKLYFCNIFLNFNTFFNCFNLYFLNLSFLILSSKKIFYVFFNKKIFKRFLYVIFYDFFVNFIPKYISYILSINNLFSNNIFLNIFFYIFLLFNLNFYIFLDINFFFILFDLSFFKKKILLTKNNIFCKKNFIFFTNYKFLNFFNYLDFFFYIFDKKCFPNEFSLNFIYCNYISTFVFYNLFNNNFLFKGNLNYFFFNKNIEYLINILYRFSFLSHSFILDKVIDFPYKNYIYIYLYKFYDLLNYNFFQISNILIILNFTFIYYNYYFLVFIPYYKSEILTEEDLIEDLFKFLKTFNLKKNIFRVNILKKNINSKDIFFKLKKLLFFKNINEVISDSFTDYYNNLFFSLNKKPLKVLNSFSKKNCIIRSSLIYGLVTNFNFFSNNSNDFYYIYELGKIYYYNVNIFNIFFIRSVAELLKFNLFFWNSYQYNSKLELIIYLFNDLFFLFKIDYLIFSIFNNISYFSSYFVFVIRDRFIGYLGEIVNLNKLKNSFILDLNFFSNYKFFFKKINIGNFFLKRDLNLFYNFSFSFINFINLVKKFFKKFNIFNILYNIYYLNKYNFYKFICIRLVFSLKFNCFFYINYLIFKLIDFFNINNFLWII